MNTESILTVKRFSGAGTSECKDALVKSNGDIYLAIKVLIHEDRILELHMDLLIRNMCPESINNPPDKLEYEIINMLYTDTTGNDFKIEPKKNPNKTKPWYQFW